MMHEQINPATGRRAIVECTPEIAVLLRAGKCLGATVVSERESFDRKAYEVLIEHHSLPRVNDGQCYPRATLKGNAAGFMEIELL